MRRSIGTPIERLSPFVSNIQSPNFLSRINVVSIARLRLHRSFSEKSSRKITRKTYDSLPSASTEHASALPMWDGGLGESKFEVCERNDLNTNIQQEQQNVTKRSRKLPDLATRSKSQKLDKAETRDDGSMRREPRNQLAKEILENLANFSHCILLTRVGQFYESYFDPAQDVARLLSIKLTQRTWDGQRVWMCGFPIMHLDKYLKILVQDHKLNVALCEEFMLPRQGADDSKTFNRRVVRVLTPGTLIDESFLNPYENNYLLAISLSKSDNTMVGIAWTDLSTGEFFARSVEFESLADELVRIVPKEIVLDRLLKSSPDGRISAALEEVDCPISYVEAYSTEADCQEIAMRTDGVAVDEIIGGVEDAKDSVFTKEESGAIHLLNHFLRGNLLEHPLPSVVPARDTTQRRMHIDAHTLKALEIRESSSDNAKGGSLLSTIKKTTTSSGTRLLTRWLTSPSTSIREIEARHALVEMFRVRPPLCDDVRRYLESVEDASRIVQKFLLGRGDSDDLVAIKRTIQVWEALKMRLLSEKLHEVKHERPQSHDEWSSVDALMSKMADLSYLANRIDAVLEDNSNAKTVESDQIIAEESVELNSSNESDETNSEWTIKPQFSAQLTELHERLKQLYIDREVLQADLQRHYDAPSLTLRSSLSSLGLHVHIAKPRRDLEKIMKSKNLVLLSESASTKSYFYQPWHKLGTSISETKDVIRAVERDAFEKLRSEVVMVSSSIRRNARILDEIDILLSFARLAVEMKYVRPKMTERSTVFRIVNGRHSTVECGLLASERMFTANSLDMSDKSHLHIITGPNMAGKSTFLRQVALIAILAQTGSYVPADYAEVGIVDRVFSRIGARDDLFKDKSTFMVEMLETAEILKNATERSLVIMDEVGRGTTVRDGLAIAFATVHHLYSRNQCRALFATHFHELAHMLGWSNVSNDSERCPGISFFCTDVVESEDGHIVYSHRLRAGVNTNSHGLKVARLAGVPPEAIATANRVLATLDSIPSQSKTESDALSGVLDGMDTRS